MKTRILFLAALVPVMGAALAAWLGQQGAPRPRHRYLKEPAPWKVPSLTEFGESIDAGDLTGDGLPDLAVGEDWKPLDFMAPHTGAAYVFPSPFEGRVFTVWPTSGFFDFGGTLAVGELNGEPPEDLVVANPSSITWPNQITVRFGPVNQGGAVTWSLGGTPSVWDMDICDVTGDGVNDLVTVATGPSKAAVYAGPLLPGTPPSGPTFTHPTGFLFSPRSVTCADWNLDGATDVLAGDPGNSSGNGRVTMFFGPDIQTFAHIVDPTGEPQSFFGTDVVAGDFDGDGIQDFAASAKFADVGSVPDAGRVYVLFGPTFSSFVSFASDTPSPNVDFGVSLAAADWDGDGIDDLAVGAPLAPFQPGTPLGEAGVWLGSDFSAPPVKLIAPPVPEEFPQGSWQEYFGLDLKGDDFDGDGLVDLAVSAKRLVTPEGISSISLAHVYFNGAGVFASSAQDGGRAWAARSGTAGRQR